MIWDYLAKKLGIPDLKVRIDGIETRIAHLENLVESSLKDLGGYKERTAEELRVMKTQIENMLDSIEALIQIEEGQEVIEDAKRLRRRLKNHKTRATKALIALAA